jgi:hypothetical protein
MYVIRSRLCEHGLETCASAGVMSCSPLQAILDKNVAVGRNVRLENVDRLHASNDFAAIGKSLAIHICTDFHTCQCINLCQSLSSLLSRVAGLACRARLPAASLAWKSDHHHDCS